MTAYTYYPPHYPLVTQILMQETKRTGLPHSQMS
jgi:hypothetical protein